MSGGAIGVTERSPISPVEPPGAEGRRAGRRRRIAIAFAVTLITVASSSFVGLAGPGALLAAPAPLSGAAHAHPSLVPTLGQAALQTTGPATAPSGVLASPLLRPLSPVYQPVTLSSVLAGLPSGLAPQAVRPTLGSTASNWFVNDHSEIGAIHQLGGSNTSLVMSAYDFATLFNASTGFFGTHGMVGISISRDGGQTWKTNWPGQNTSWATTGNKDYGDVLQGWFLPSFAYSVRDAQPLIATNNTGKNIVLLSPYGPACWFYTGCTSASLFNASSGVAVVRSTDGGTTLSKPSPLSAGQWWYLAPWAGGCNLPANTYLVPGKQVNSLALSENGANNHVYAAWATTDWYYPGGHTPSSLLFCNTTVTPNAVFYGWAAPGGGVIYNLTVSVSANGAASWSTPVNVGHNFTAAWRGLWVKPPIASPHVSVGPAPGYNVSVAFTDWPNATSQGVIPIAEIRSTNNGTTWTKSFDTGIQSTWMGGSTTDWFNNQTAPIIVSDNWTGSAYKGREYMVWNDNRSASAGSGYPSIAFSMNTTASGARWSSPAFVSANTPLTLRYFMPSIAVQPNGRIWVSYYGVSVGSGAYRTYGIYSDNGGATWSGQFVVSDAAGQPVSGSDVAWTGASPQIAATSAGAYVAWLDCRANDCVRPSYNTTSWIARVLPAKVTTNAAGIVNVTINVSSYSTVYPLSGPGGVLKLGWDYNATISIGVPDLFPTPNGSYIQQFQGFSGAVTSGTNPATFSYQKGDVLVSYVLVPGAWIIGSIKPVVPGTAVRIQGPTGGVLIPRITAIAGTNTFNQTVAGGHAYTVNVTAPNYNRSVAIVPTQDLKKSYYNVTLGKVVGWIAGSIVPKNANVWINDSNGSGRPTVGATGLYNVSRAWGWFTVEATLAGYKNFSQRVQVTPGHTTPLRVVVWGSHIYGTVRPLQATVTIGGNATPVNYGTFNQSLPGGIYIVRASYFGYSVFQQQVVVLPGQNQSVNIGLTNKGWIVGGVTPISAVITVNGAPQTVTNGLFNISELGSTGTKDSIAYQVSAQSIGYISQTKTVNVTPGNVSSVTFTLVRTGPPPCNKTTDPTCPGYTGGGGGVATPQSNTLLYVGVGVIAALAVAIAVVLLMRRGKGGSAAQAPSSPETEPAPPQEPTDGGGTPPSY